MFSSISSVQGVVVLVLGLAALGAEVFALLDALRHRPDAFVAAGKRTKNFWLLVLGVATAVGFVSNVLSMFGGKNRGGFHRPQSGTTAEGDAEG